MNLCGNFVKNTFLVDSYLILSFYFIFIESDLTFYYEEKSTQVNIKVI